MKEVVLRLQQDVAAQKNVIDSTKTLLSGLSAQLKAAIASADAGDTTALNELASEIEAQTADLASAVATDGGGTAEGAGSGAGADANAQ